MSEPLMAETIIRAWRALTAIPCLGAIVGVRSWPETGLVLELTVDGVDERGWRTVERLAGDEAVRIAKRYEGAKVAIMSEADLRSVEQSRAVLCPGPFSVPVFLVDGGQQYTVDDLAATQNTVEQSDG